MVAGLPPPEDPQSPKYWMNETSGVLEPAVQAYLKGWPLSVLQIGVLRAYLRQWIQSPVWDMNPHITEESRTQLAQLRSSVEMIRTRQDVETWTALSQEMCIDPW